MAAFELCFSIRKEFLKKKVSGENAFDLISVFHVQIQQPKSRSTTTTAFVFLGKFAEFYYHKIFETSLWPLYNWRYTDCTQCNPFNDVYLLSKFDVSNFSVAGDI